MYFVLAISIVLVLIILALTIFAISKGYAYKHTVDELDGSSDHLDGSLVRNNMRAKDEKDEKINEER